MLRLKHTLPSCVPSLIMSTQLLSGHLTSSSTSMEKVQKRAARWAIGDRWNRQLNSLSSPVVGIDCINFSDYFAFKRRSLKFHPYSLSIPKSHVNAFRFSYFVNAPFVWNQLPPPILESSSLFIFKFSLSKMLLHVS